MEGGGTDEVLTESIDGRDRRFLRGEGITTGGVSAGRTEGESVFNGGTDNGYPGGGAKNDRRLNGIGD